MKRSVLRIGLVMLIVCTMFGPLGQIASAGNWMPPEDPEVLAAIEDGLAWLVAQQNDDGSWGGDCESIARTGLVALKLKTWSLENDNDPKYEAEIAAAVQYILANSRPDPEGVYWDRVCGEPRHIIYNTGIAMMALAINGDPGGNLQAAVDFMAWAQADPGCGDHRGGWRYSPDQCSSDQSNSGYATLGLGYAEAFGATVPEIVKSELSIWIDVIQDDVDGDANDGGSWYTPSSSWVNILKTGNLLYEMALVGDTVETQRVKDAIDYIERHWDDPGGCDTGWRDHRQAMFTMMKGFEAFGIREIDLDDDGIPETDWFEVVSEHLIATQNADGSWPWDCWGGDDVLSTVWALLTLERAVPPIEFPVPVDVKPMSCRNPINSGQRGVLPVAIVGTEDYDVSQVDPATVRLFRKGVEDPAMVAPLRWALEDAATPYEPYLGKDGCYACTEEGPDGIVDLSLKFDAPEVVAALGDIADGDCIPVLVVGRLREECGGFRIIGEDVVAILEKGK